MTTSDALGTALALVAVGAAAAVATAPSPAGFLAKRLGAEQAAALNLGMAAEGLPKGPVPTPRRARASGCGGGWRIQAREARKQATCVALPHAPQKLPPLTMPCCPILMFFCSPPRIADLTSRWKSSWISGGPKGETRNLGKVFTVAGA